MDDFTQPRSRHELQKGDQVRCLDGRYGIVIESSSTTNRIRIVDDGVYLDTVETEQFDNTWSWLPDPVFEDMFGEVFHSSDEVERELAAIADEMDDLEFEIDELRLQMDSLEERWEDLEQLKWEILVYEETKLDE